MSLGKKLRFEVFKRDSFTCQYCGRKAPDVVLHVDHIHPRAEGGSDDLLNLVTSCVPCNLGKGSTPLSDDSAVVKQRRQLEELQERHEQLAMMIEWQRGLANLGNQELDEAVRYWCELVHWPGLTPEAQDKVGKLIRKYGLSEVLEAMRKSRDHYAKRSPKGAYVDETTEEAFRRLPGVCHLARQDQQQPNMKQVFFLRKVLINRFESIDKVVARDLIELAFAWGADREELYRIVASCRSYSHFRTLISQYIDELEEESERAGG